MAIAVTMCKLLLAMGIGVFAYRTKILNEDTTTRLSSLVVNITLPCLIINSVSSVPSGGSSDVIRLILIGLLMYGIFIVLGILLTRLLRVPKHLRGIYTCMIVFSNNAFMGYPVVQALFGDVAIFYITMFNLPMNALFFSLGMYLIRRDHQVEMGIEAKKGGTSLRKIFNNGLIASLLSVVIYFAAIPIPEGVYSCLDFIGGLTTPLSMIIIGSSVAGISIKQIKQEKQVFSILPIRLILCPIITFFIIRLFLDDPTLVAIGTISFGMPIASIVGMGSAGFETQHRSAALAVALTTICSLVTIPVMSVLLI